MNSDDNKITIKDVLHMIIYFLIFEFFCLGCTLGICFRIEDLSLKFFFSILLVFNGLLGDLFLMDFRDNEK